jgi:hypothetical protein
MQLVMQNVMNCQTPTIKTSEKLVLSEISCSLTIPEIEIEIHPLPESDLDLDALAILGDPIRRAFLAPQFFQAVGSRISGLPSSARRLQKWLKKQAYQSNSNQSDFTLGILARFEREPENSSHRKMGFRVQANRDINRRRSGLSPSSAVSHALSSSACGISSN